MTRPPQSYCIARRRFWFRSKCTKVYSRIGDRDGRQTSRRSAASREDWNGSFAPHKLPLNASKYQRSVRRFLRNGLGARNQHLAIRSLPRCWQFHLLVKDNSREQIELANPGRTVQGHLGVSMAGVPALHDAGRTEVDILCMALHIQLRREQPDHVHRSLADISSQFSHGIAVALRVGQARGKLAN